MDENKSLSKRNKWNKAFSYFRNHTTLYFSGIILFITVISFFSIHKDGCVEIDFQHKIYKAGQCENKQNK